MTHRHLRTLIATAVTFAGFAPAVHGEPVHDQMPAIGVLTLPAIGGSLSRAVP